MPKFPTRQTDIKALAIAMAFGAWDHRDDFPSIDVFEIAGAINLYVSARDAQNQAAAAAKLATEAKNISLKILIESMRKCLKKSEVDTAANPEKLALIGWGTKANRQQAELPGQPSNLQTVSQGKGFVQLKWDRPTGGGALRNYIIEGRQQDQSGDFGPWHLAATTYQTENNLSDQPQGVQLEYRVKAINTGGESLPSNSVALVL